LIFIQAFSPFLLNGTGNLSAEEFSTNELLFARRVHNLLHEKCLACHGRDPAKIEGKLDLTTLEFTLQGGASGEPALVKGQPKISAIYLAITRDHADWSPMPPKEADKLYPEQIKYIEDWIKAGAAWPDEKRLAEINKHHQDKWASEDGILMPTKGALSEQWANRRYKPAGMWGYQPLKKPGVPVVADAQDVPASRADVSPIDAFIIQSLPEGLAVAEPAERQVLIRRATFDLTGLPPTAEDIHAFELDPDPLPRAFSKVVDRLLASPHYGEKMAQHWLDVVRYADTAGLANDFERGNAWRYRDYVLRAFNNDKPYDQFVREQLAGDEIDPENPEMLLATGFLRMGPWELTGMEVAKVARQRFLDDVTNSVGETFLAHSLQCARCHDHKFDPVPTHDYYAIQAVFATTQICERPASFLPTENLQGFAERTYLDQRRNDFRETLSEIEDKLLIRAEQWYQENQKDPQLWLETLRSLKSAPDNTKSTGKKKESNYFEATRQALIKKKIPETEIPPKLVGFTTEEFGKERMARKGLERLKWEDTRYEPVALSIYNGVTPNLTAMYNPFYMPKDTMANGELEKSAILTGGDPFSPMRPVEPGVLSTISNLPETQITLDVSGRRLAFAKWVTHPAHPLTTRTMVNRLWLWHMNQAIAGNPNNFGSTGKVPSHQALLDYLAVTFVEQGWSIKAMHKLIMNSSAYRRSADHPAFKHLKELDPNQTSYAVFLPRRLTAGEIRDAMLMSSGELNLQLGGIPCRPEINLEAALQPRMVMGTFASAWVPNPLPQQRHRRSIYALKVRGIPDPFKDVFNEPAPDFSCERREASTVTPQVFSLFNGQATYDRALAMANNVSMQSNTDINCLKSIYLKSYGREPTVNEISLCLKYWKQMEIVEHNRVLIPRELPYKVKREAVEENTGENFTFDETLHAYADFVPDLQPEDVSAKVRGLADVCLAIMNSNEFVYVY
jgi:hypothetical protein